MVAKRFRVVARVSSSNPRAIKPVLERAIPMGSIREAKGEYLIEAEMEGDSSKELNRLMTFHLYLRGGKCYSQSYW
jgi:hypothetical protein